MKRTLLVSAFAVMTLAASAQISEVTKVKGDGFDFIPKGLTTTGVITPYSTIGVENNSSNQTSEFTVYDALTWRKLLIMTLGYSKAIWYQ